MLVLGSQETIQCQEVCRNTENIDGEIIKSIQRQHAIDCMLSGKQKVCASLQLEFVMLKFQKNPAGLSVRHDFQFGKSTMVITTWSLCLHCVLDWEQEFEEADFELTQELLDARKELVRCVSWWCVLCARRHPIPLQNAADCKTQAPEKQDDELALIGSVLGHFCFRKLMFFLWWQGISRAAGWKGGDCQQPPRHRTAARATWQS